MLFEIHPLTPEKTTAYASMTFPTREPLLQRAGADRRLVALGATFRDRPIGLALAALAIGSVGFIRTLYVTPAGRGLGFGTALLRRTERALTRRDRRSPHLPGGIGDD